MELPMPRQQAEQPLQSWQSAFTMSSAVYNLPSEISFRSIIRSMIRVLPVSLKHQNDSVCFTIVHYRSI